jgi:hypothetical protein
MKKMKMAKKQKRMAKVELKINAFPCLPILSSISESNISIYIIMQFVCTLLFVKVNNISFQYFFEKYYSCFNNFNKATRKYDHMKLASH